MWVGGFQNKIAVRICLDHTVPTLSVKRNKNFISAIGRSVAHRRKLRKTFCSTATIGNSPIAYT
jgi:hypothetical protein